MPMKRQISKGSSMKAKEEEEEEEEEKKEEKYKSEENQWKLEGDSSGMNASAVIDLMFKDEDT